MKTKARRSRKKRKVPGGQRPVPKRVSRGAFAGAKEALRGEEKYFRVVADSLPELICYIDAQGRYQFNNKAYEKRYGISAEQFKGRTIREVMGDEGYALVQPYIEEALRGERCTREGYLPHKLADRGFYKVDYVPDKDPDGKVRGIYILIQDLTELKQTEEMFRAFVETAPDAMIIHNRQGNIIVVNAQAERMFGYSKQELIGQPIDILIPERFRKTHVKERAAYMENPVTRSMGAGLELFARRKDGYEFPVEVILSPVETSEGALVSGSIRDLTDRKQFAEQIRWATALEERNRIARDVHDTLAQGFTGIILNLEMVEEACAGLPDEAKKRIARARDVARSSLEEARRSILALSTSPSIDTDLPTAIRALLDRYQPSSKTRMELSVQGRVCRLDRPVEENLLRIVQQATNNALQHAHAGSIRIMLVCGEEEAQIKITDDGQGFDIKKADHGMGLMGMRERAKEIGAKFELVSQPGKGTQITITVPHRPMVS
jgi:PAS domain S-box-containing protein